MNEDLARIRRLLGAARRRWFWHTVLAAVTRALLVAAVVLLVAWSAFRLGNFQGRATSTAVLAGAALIGVAAGALRAAWPLRRRPTDAQVARFVEEHFPQLEDRLVTAVESSSRRAVPEAPAFAGLLYRDAARRFEAIDLDAMIGRRAVARRGLIAVGAALGLAVLVVLAWPDVRTGVAALGRTAFPAHLAIRVTPGDARVMANNAFTVRARMDNLPPGARPTIIVEDRRGRAERAMTAANAHGEFSYTFPQVSDAFRYSVSVRSSRSNQYAVTVVNPARVTRIDVRYEYPAGYGVASRVEEDGGDVYGPPGTRVQLSVNTDKPVREGVLTLDDGSVLPLEGKGERLLSGTLKISDDGSYRVALTDREGLRNAGETEYFIRVIADAPPDVRIVKPAADRQVTPLEEVPVVARADDDHGVKDFELVYSVRGGPEQRLPFAVQGDRRSLDGTRVMYLEDLHVRPGDFVTYYARARDGAPGKASGEARSDLFFLEVTAFDDEFQKPQSQSSGSGGMSAAGRSAEDLIRAQKAIVVATWKLDRRSRRSASAGSEDDVRTVARAQGELRTRAMEAAGTAPAASRNGGVDGGDPMANAVAAMGRAEESLNAAKTADALPHETAALNELMRAEASQRRKQLLQASGGGSGADAGNSNADLSTMFDRELQREQKTNYELPQNQARQDRQQSDVMERLRQLAERQGELSQRQQDLDRNRAQMQADEFKRQLERLTREQSDLRQQAEQLGDQLRSKSQQGQPAAQRGGGQRQAAGGRSQAGDGADAAMRKASEAMREAAARLRDGKLGEAGRQGQQALGNLQSAEDEMRRRQRGEDAGSPLGDLHMEARRAADAQRQIAGQAAAAGTGPKAADAMRRLAGEKERLADQVERLQKDLKNGAASPALEGHQREALQGAAVDLERLQLPKQMRDSAAAMRDPSKGDVNRPESAAKEEDLAKTLDRLADRVGGASGSRDTAQSSDRLARTRDIKDRLAELERRMNELQRSGNARGQSSKGARAGEPPQGPVGTSGRPGDDNAAGLERLREEYQRELQRAAEHLDALRRAGVGTTPEGQGQQILSARGYHQDFSEWQQLSHGINAGLDRAETELSQKLRDQQALDRLQAPPAGQAPEQYRRLVEQYYQALAGKARK